MPQFVDSELNRRGQKGIRLRTHYLWTFLDVSQDHSSTREGEADFSSTLSGLVAHKRFELIARFERQEAKNGRCRKHVSVCNAFR